VLLEDLPSKVCSSDPWEYPAAEAQGELGARHGAPALTSLADVERNHILKALKLLGGNKSLAADLLGIDRRTLHRRLQQYDLNGRSH